MGLFYTSVVEDSKNCRKVSAMERTTVNFPILDILYEMSRKGKSTFFFINHIICVLWVLSSSFSIMFSKLMATYD